MIAKMCLCSLASNGCESSLYAISFLGPESTIDRHRQEQQQGQHFKARVTLIHSHMGSSLDLLHREHFNKWDLGQPRMYFTVSC